MFSSRTQKYWYKYTNTHKKQYKDKGTTYKYKVKPDRLKWNSLLNHNNILVALPTRYFSTQGRWRHQLLLRDVSSVLVCSCICVYVNLQGVFLHSRPFKASTSPLKMCPRLAEKLFGPNLNPFFCSSSNAQYFTACSSNPLSYFTVFYSMSYFTVFYSMPYFTVFYSSNSLCCILQQEKALLSVLPHLTQTLTHNGGG